VNGRDGGSPAIALRNATGFAVECWSLDDDQRGGKTVTTSVVTHAENGVADPAGRIHT
jgi:hypothetical protein